MTSMACSIFLPLMEMTLSPLRMPARAGRTARFDVQRLNRSPAIDPRYAVFGQVKLALLLEIQGGSNHRGHGEDHQQRADELLLEFLQP